ncbi:unnamed protein product [Arctogadus glacialis]
MPKNSHTAKHYPCFVVVLHQLRSPSLPASLQPCRCPVWEKHSISYPTSSDAPFQSQLLLACLPFLSDSIQPCHVGCEDQLLPSGQCNCNNLYTGLTFCSV